MANKKGKSEKKTSFWGKEYVQHYDSKGNKSGRSERKETFWGKKYTQHYDSKGEKRGKSEKKETWTGKEYTQKYNTRGEKSGKSENKEGFFGNQYRQHFDQQGNKTDWSENKETFFGNKYRQRYGDEKPKAPRVTSSARAGSGSYAGGDSSSVRPTAVFGFVIGGVLLLGLFSLLVGLIGSISTRKIDPPRAESLGNAYVNTLQLNVRRGPGTEYGVITRLARGTMVACLERSQNSHGQEWIKVRFASSEGWVNEEYLSQSSPIQEETLATATPETPSSEEPQPSLLPEQQVNPDAEPLPPPRPLSPPHGGVMNHYPRHTTVAWEPVEGADTYTVEIQFLSGTVWSDLTEFHNSYPASGYVPPIKLRDTKFSFIWVGENAGRWRVWAVDANNKEGYKSEWWQFHFAR